MRRVMLAVAATALCLAPNIASAKLPFFGLEVAPSRPGVGEPIRLTMTCFDDEDHTRLWSSCLGAGSTMAWVHPLDEEGGLDRSDWIHVDGHATASGATVGRITLHEAGAYDVLPLWRGWGAQPGDAFPDPIRVEVGEHLGPVPAALAAVLGIAATGLIVAVRKRRGEPGAATT